MHSITLHETSCLYLHSKERTSLHITAACVSFPIDSRRCQTHRDGGSFWNNVVGVPMCSALQHSNQCTYAFTVVHFLEWYCIPDVRNLSFSVCTPCQSQLFSLWIGFFVLSSRSSFLISSLSLVFCKFLVAVAPTRSLLWFAVNALICTPCLQASRDQTVFEHKSTFLTHGMQVHTYRKPFGVSRAVASFWNTLQAATCWAKG